MQRSIMWELLLAVAAGTGFLARCLVKRPALPKEEELTEDGILNCYADNTGSVGLVCEFGLEIPTRISDGESSQIGGDAKIDPYVFPMNEQASGDVSATFICSHDGFPVMSSSFSHGGFPVMPSSWKGNAKGFHGYRGRWFGLDAQCSESLDFQLSKDHGSNSSGLRNMGRTQKRNLRKKIRTGLQKREKVSRHVAGKKLDADVVGQYQQSEGALWFSYGVGIGVMFMHESRKCEIDKLTSLLNQTVGMVQELKRQLDERRDYLQNSEMPKACHGEIYTYQQENLGAAANWMLEKDPESVCSSFKDNESAFIIDEPAQQVTGMVELEAELQVRLEYIQMDFLQSNSKHQREKTEYSESTDSSDVVDERLYANGLLGQWSSANKNPFVPSEVFHADDYGVSPYEFDRRLCDLLEKQQEETISELEVELKSTEIELHARERELQHWKEHVRHLVEFSFGTDSGDESASLESVSFEKTNNADGKRQDTRQASLKSSVKSVINSEHEGNYEFPSLKSSVKSVINSEHVGNYEFPLWSFNHCIEGPLEFTADSMEQLNYRGETNTHLMN